MGERVTLSFEDAQRLFDLALQMDSACSGWFDSDDTETMRRLAVSIGVDPKVATPGEYTSRYPHDYVSPPSDVKDRARPRIAFDNGRNWRGTMPDPDYVPSGGWPCHASSGRCGKLQKDEIHG